MLSSTSRLSSPEALVNPLKPRPSASSAAPPTTSTTDGWNPPVCIRRTYSDAASPRIRAIARV